MHTKRLRPLPEPTEARPGSPEKVAILEERQRLGQRLWHPSDAQQAVFQKDQRVHRYKADYAAVNAQAWSALAEKQYAARMAQSDTTVRVTLPTSS